MSIWKILSEGIMGKPPKIYSEQTADEVLAKLDHLAQHPKGLQIKELVFRARPKIEAAQQAGHSLDEIVKAFEESGVKLTLNTLKRYLQESRAQLPNGKIQESQDSVQVSNSANPKQAKPLAQTKEKGSKTETKSDSKPHLTNTNKDGFQEMRSNEDL